MKLLLFISLVFLANAKNDLRWPKEREFSWAPEVPELISEEYFSLKGKLNL